MDTASAKKYNESKGWRPDPAIAFFDALAENTPETKIMKLPKVPNTKGKYLAQYVDTSGTASIYQSFGPRTGGVKHFVVYRVLPHGVVKYFFEVDTVDFKNNNSRNHYLVGTLGEMYKDILAYRKKLKVDQKTVFELMEFKMNLDRLIEEKKDTTLHLRKAISAITGKKVDKIVAPGSYDEVLLRKALSRFNEFRRVISELEDNGLLSYKK